MVSKIFIGVFCIIIMKTSLCVGIDINGERTDGNNKCELKLNDCSLQMDIPGKHGEKGERGPTGVRGPRGDRGATGLQGRDSDFNETCPELFQSESFPQVGENIIIRGSLESPFDAPCNSLQNEEKGIIWVKPYDAFEVDCTKYSELTCLVLPTPKDQKYIADNAFHSPSQTPFWLSNYYSDTGKNQRFNLLEFYNKITPVQINWLRQNTKETIMKIRIHCKNFWVNSSEDSALHLLSWNDVVIRPYISDVSPLSYTIDESAHGCKEDVQDGEWRFTDITVKGDNKRLPVIDFHIRDTQKETQSFFLELLELCFG